MKKLCFVLCAFLLLASIYFPFSVAAEETKAPIPELLENFPVKDARYMNEAELAAIQSLISNFRWSGIPDQIFSGADKTYDNIHQDQNVFIVGYNESDALLNSFSESGGIPDDLTSRYPTVYVPIFGTLDGVEYIVGYSRLVYDYWDKTYERNDALYSEFGLLNESIFMTSLGMLDNYRAASEAIGAEVTTGILLLVNYQVASCPPATYGVLLAQAQGKWYIYDPANTAYLPDGEEHPVLSPQEYVRLREEGEIRNRPAYSDELKSFVWNTVFLIVGVLGIALLVFVILLILWIVKTCRKLHRRRKAYKEFLK